MVNNYPLDAIENTAKNVILNLMRLSQPQTTSQPVSTERRSQARYPVELELQCKLVGSETMCQGKTTDVSSSGARFRIDRELPVGTTVELRIKWPMRCPGNFPLELVLEGHVLRSDASGTAIQTQRYAIGTRRMIAIWESRSAKPDTRVA